MNKQGSSYSHRLMAAMALLSVALIAYQVAVIQLLSFIQWYHYANMVISIALLGFGAAGTVLSLLRTWLMKHSNTLLPVLMILSGLTMVLAVELTGNSFARFDSYLLFTDRTQWFRLLLNSLFYLVPFFLGALAIGIIFIKYVEEIGRFYFSNLAGSGVGAVLAAVMAWYFLPASLPVVMALISLVAGLLVISVKKQWYIVVLAAGIAVFIFYRTDQPVRLKQSEYKSLSKTMNLPSSRVFLQKPGPFGLVQVVSADALRYAPGLSLAFDKEVGVKSAVFNNGDWYGPLDSWSAEDSFHLLDYTTMAIPYVLKKRNRVLVLSAGTGLHVSHGLSKGAQEIDAVESHRGIYDLILEDLVVANDSLAHRRGVHFHNTEPRSFLSASRKKYDLIQLPMTGSFGGGVGLYAMREEYILTKQAFLEMWDLLEKDGIISITAWMDYPFRNPLKIMSTLSESLDDAGIMNKQNYITAIRSWGTVTFMLKRAPFSVQDTMAIRRFCDEYFFDILWMPGLKKEERSVYNGIGDSSFFTYTDELLFGDRRKLYDEYGFHIRPATDDKPYFSQFLRWKSLSRLSDIFGAQAVPFLELGWLISAVSFLLISALAILLILLPLFKIGMHGGYKAWTLLYFSGLGAGYMLLEIVLIQKFILFFGNPVYAASFIICVMMLASGAGSYYSSRVIPGQKELLKILVMISLILLFYTFFLSPILNQVAGNSGLLKLFISVPVVALPAVLMGMPFPLGLRLLAEREEKNVPWAWGINGCVSVISASLAALLAVELGFSAVILLSATFYGVSLGATYLVKK